MIQMQNEVGVLGDSRDHSAAANEAFAKVVPKELMDYLQKNRESLNPDFRKVWEDSGSKTSGTWAEVFGTGPAADEIFMAWHYAQYMNRLTEAGKTEYPLPVFVNAWIVQPEDKGPGDYPSGGPEPLVHDVWKAVAPQIDIWRRTYICRILPNGAPGSTARITRCGSPRPEGTQEGSPTRFTPSDNTMPSDIRPSGSTTPEGWSLYGRMELHLRRRILRICRYPRDMRCFHSWRL